jgi:hypothetical protein
MTELCGAATKKKAGRHPASALPLSLEQGSSDLSALHYNRQKSNKIRPGPARALYAVGT